VSGIAAFSAEELKKVKTKEPLSGLELLKQVLPIMDGYCITVGCSRLAFFLLSHW
jgi:hypothetical protein